MFTFTCESRNLFKYPLLNLFSFATGQNPINRVPLEQGIKTQNLHLGVSLYCILLQNKFIHVYLKFSSQNTAIAITKLKLKNTEIINRLVFLDFSPCACNALKSSEHRSYMSYVHLQRFCSREINKQQIISYTLFDCSYAIIIIWYANYGNSRKGRDFLLCG